MGGGEPKIDAVQVVAVKQQLFLQGVQAGRWFSVRVLLLCMVLLSSTMCKADLLLLGTCGLLESTGLLMQTLRWARSQRNEGNVSQFQFSPR